MDNKGFNQKIKAAMRSANSATAPKSTRSPQKNIKPDTMERNGFEPLPLNAEHLS
jgi:hypothetical protein